MSSVESPVTQVPGFTILGGAALEPQTYTLYTLNTAEAERIETVYMTLQYPGQAVNNDVYVVELHDVSGFTVAAQPTPAITLAGATGQTVFLTWSRLGNDTAQLPVFTSLNSVDGALRAWCNLRLPDLVLAPGAFVSFVAWRDTNNEGADLVVSDATVTVTRGDGTGATTTLIDVLPLLSPTDQA